MKQTTKYLCTLFDSNYMHLGLSLIDSVQKHFDDYLLFILALDNNCYDRLIAKRLPNTVVLRLSEVMTPDVSEAKANRSWQEFCWTLSSVLTYHVLVSNHEIGHITYLDSDIYFYANPEPIYNEIGNSSIMIIPHRFPPRFKHLEVNGIYNVQMVYFKRDTTGISCLKQWRDQCVDWCYYISEPDRMGDQKYLDSWPKTFSNVCVLSNIAAGVAIWNVEQYELSVRKRQIFVDQQALIFYHFHSFKFYAGDMHTTGMAGYGLAYGTLAPIYEEYVRTVIRVFKENGLQKKRLLREETIAMFQANNLHIVSACKRMVLIPWLRLLTLMRRLWGN